MGVGSIWPAALTPFKMAWGRPSVANGTVPPMVRLAAGRARRPKEAKRVQGSLEAANTLGGGWPEYNGQPENSAEPPRGPLVARPGAASRGARGGPRGLPRARGGANAAGPAAPAPRAVEGGPGPLDDAPHPGATGRARLPAPVADAQLVGDRIAAQDAQARVGRQRLGVHEAKQPEPARVLEPQHRAVGEAQRRVDVRHAVARGLGVEQPPAAHAQVGEEGRPVVELEQ